MKKDWKIVAVFALGCGFFSFAGVVLAAAFGFVSVGRPAGDAVRGYLMAHPEILVDMTNELQAKQETATDNARQLAVDKLGIKAFFDPRLAFITGPVKAKTTLIEFFDYNCGHCRNSLASVKKFYEQHKKDTRFAFIEFPMKGQESVFAARAAIAARKQPEKYLVFHFLMMGEKSVVTPDVVYADARRAGLDLGKLTADISDTSVVDQTIAATLSLAQAANIDGTPAFIVNGKMHEGEVSRALLSKLTKRVPNNSP